MAGIIRRYKIILWDFDGVIINSNEVREQGFIEALSSYPASEVDQLIQYHRINGGLSRYVKFRYFFEEIRNEKVEEDKIISLAKDFSQIMLENLKNPDLLISDSVNFIKKHYINYEMHIVSGSDQKELRLLCSSLGIDKYFRSINGSPTPKIKLVSNIIKEKQVALSDYCLIGDSINDYEAARANSIDFFGFNNLELIEFGNYLNNIYDLSGEQKN